MKSILIARGHGMSPLVWSFVKEQVNGTHKGRFAAE